MKAATRRRTGISQFDLLRLSGEARLDPRTVQLVLQDDPRCEAKSRQLVIDAAARLGMALAIGDSPKLRAY